MAKDRNLKSADASASGKPTDPPSPPVKVRAKTALAEMVGGEMRRFAPGEEFESTESRATALGPLVEILK